MSGNKSVLATIARKTDPVVVVVAKLPTIFVTLSHMPTICEFKPKKYIEIGSGNSTKVVRKSIKDNDLKTIVTSIDPFPRANIDHLADKVLRFPVENMDDHSVFAEMEKGDILFIDNSHRAFPNSVPTIFLVIKQGMAYGFHMHPYLVGPPCF